MIVVTGGAGFIGSNIVKALNEKGRNDILIVDNLKNSAKHLNLNRLDFADYIDKTSFFDIFDEIASEIEIVFHQGACSDTMESDGKYMMENNYDYSCALFNNCVQQGIRFIYASSASVYGNGDDGFIEKSECEYPLNVYAFSKYLFDSYVRKFPQVVKTQVVGLRYFNVFGPQENHKGRMASVIRHFFNQYRENKHIKVFEGSTEFKRDFIHVDDVVNVNMHFMENSFLNGIYNCGTGEYRTFADIADVFKKRYTDALVSEIPFPESLVGKYQKYTQADVDKLRSAGYEGEFMSLEDGVNAYLDVLEKTDGYIK
ncbi:ADP-L-glycero-D-manno-heptose-6-epimerase [Denitrovibrio acetiphilus DSM 12809]|uniref:ADP-L-glycero-D-manno-heptose-6-epimerase n=1 Tax=Denitrovibrio acetiphilus (strain DSM 12809 / NBRC 114555 / N2460) TaxID=522772 RepID=D4H0V2_DENA2|nr:ADP-glyceromanno-heptose 6-epimerase [Denitrovibrio acetiphilus]ADD68615.1 ADP-L-glycero-D-manno-heptose-6-epimerase [Denitrovibrio acetiphilus DSM 12809]